MPDDATPPEDVSDGDHCRVVAGTHKGRSGTVEDSKTSKTGHVTITVREESGERFKTLARNVAVQPGRARRAAAIRSIHYVKERLRTVRNRTKVRKVRTPQGA